MKLRDEVETAGPKSAQTRFVRIIPPTIHPYVLAFLDEKFPLLFNIMARGVFGGGG